MARLVKHVGFNMWDVGEEFSSLRASRGFADQ